MFKHLKCYQCMDVAYLQLYNFIMYKLISCSGTTLFLTPQERGTYSPKFGLACVMTPPKPFTLYQTRIYVNYYQCHILHLATASRTLNLATETPVPDLTYIMKTTPCPRLNGVLHCKPVITQCSRPKG